MLFISSYSFIIVVLYPPNTSPHKTHYHKTHYHKTTAYRNQQTNGYKKEYLLKGTQCY